MLAASAGDTEDQVGLLVAPLDAVGVLVQGDAGLLDGVLRLVGAVRNRDAQAHVYALDLLALKHGVNVALIHGAVGHKQLAGGADSLFLGNGGAAQLNAVAVDGDGGLGLGLDLLRYHRYVGLAHANAVAVL